MTDPEIAALQVRVSDHDRRLAVLEDLSDSLSDMVIDIQHKGAQAAERIEARFGHIENLIEIGARGTVAIVCMVGGGLAVVTIHVGKIEVPTEWLPAWLPIASTAFAPLGVFSAVCILLWRVLSPARSGIAELAGFKRRKET